MQQKIDGLLVPKLRFPEFQDEGEWEEKTLGEICKFIRGPFGGSLKKDMFVKDGYAVYEQSHAIYQTFDSFRYYIAEDKFNELKRFSVHPNDLIMSCSGTMGKFAIIPKESKRGVINQALLKLTAKKGLDIRFIKTTMELPSSQEKLLSQSAGGAIKNVVAVGQIKEIILYIPSIPEQQKITACLSSISDRITAETQKLDTLKTHKKGLMQQLFPAEGETLPKLRFPEFQNAGEWEMKKLGDFGEFKNGINFSADKKGSGTLTVDVLNMYGAGIETKLDSLYRVDMDAKDYLLRDGDILFVRSSMKREGIGWASLFRDFSEPVLFCGFLIRLRLTSFELTDPNFLLYYLRSDFGREKIISISGTAAITNISQDSLKVIPAIIPALPEQQKIADCLSSLDELIAAQTQAIDTLKIHKKGLMQQLFPSVEEVKGWA